MYNRAKSQDFLALNVRDYETAFGIPKGSKSKIIMSIYQKLGGFDSANLGKLKEKSNRQQSFEKEHTGMFLFPRRGKLQTLLQQLCTRKGLSVSIWGLKPLPQWQ